MKKKIKAWADVGTHGGIFAFRSGVIGDRYPGLMHIYDSKLTHDLIPVTITYEFQKKYPETKDSNE